MCPSCKQWSDEYNELSKEFQAYREKQEAKIIKLQDSLENRKQEIADLRESNAFLRESIGAH